jgi:hypothetical protein
MMRQAQSDINITFDISDSENDLQFIVITASFIDKDG